MVRDISIIQNWLNIEPLTHNEIKLLCNATRKYDRLTSNNQNNIITNNGDMIDYENLENFLFSKMPYSNISSKTHILEVHESARKIISFLFDKYVDSNTLVITSDCEHPSVVDNFYKCKNIVKLNNDDRKYLYKNKLNRLTNEIKKFNKVFVYIVGTFVMDGSITPSSTFSKIIDICKQYNKNIITVLDDVQGMYLIPRDYSKFDYVIGTVHALIKKYDMGIVIHKKDIPQIAYIDYNNLKEYCYYLNIYLNKCKKIFLFNYIMSNYYKDLSGDFHCITNYSSNIFSIKCNKKLNENIYNTLKEEFDADIDGYNDDDNPNNEMYIRLRGQQYIIYPEKLLGCIKFMDKNIFGVYNDQY